MDAFEAIRQEASKLHFKVANSAKQLCSMDLIHSALEFLDIELHWVSTDDPILKNSRALFDDQSGAIIAEDIGSQAERALLVAHEIGHSCIHSTSLQCTSGDINPSISADSSNTSIQRLQDYGLHERQELQANVFAREFLFPRELAYQMYIVEGLNANTIAKKLDLPLPLIRQQILDVLLLPKYQSDEPLIAKVTQYIADPAQERAVKHRGTPFQLQAGPGTGKTKTLVNRIVSLLNDGIDPASILVLTFSNKAATELFERVSAIVPESAPKIWIGTFHAFGLDILRRHYDKMDLPADPALFDRSDAISILEEILPTLPLVHCRNLWDPILTLKEVLNAISRAKDELVGPEAYRELAQRMLDNTSDADTIKKAEKNLEISFIYESYERAKKNHGAVDFGDLVMMPALLLENDKTLQAAIQMRHRHILVDEYQDVNHASVRLVKALAGDGKRLWVVGDARQSIYRFRGASSTNMIAFKAEYPDAKIDQLGISYRSNEQIISLFGAFAPNMGASEGMLPLNLLANRGIGPEIPQLRIATTAAEEAIMIADAIKELQNSGTNLRNQAVLCRSNARLNEIAEILESRGIPALHLGSLFERSEIRDLLSLLSLIVDPYGDALVRVATQPRYDISMQDIYIFLKGLDKNCSALSQIGKISDIEKISQKGLDAFNKMAEDLQNVSPQDNAWDFLTSYLLDRTDRGRLMAKASTISERMQNIAVWQFLNFLREQNPIGQGLPIKRILNRIRQMVLLGEERDLRNVPSCALHMDAVRLMTIHGSKGLEFEAVHIPGLVKGNIPASYRGERYPPPEGLIKGSHGLSVLEEVRQSHEHEEECLFFVAVSRARTYLKLYSFKHTVNGKNISPSDFLDKISQHIKVFSNSKNSSSTEDVADIRLTNIRYPLDWKIYNQQLGLYEKCPQRYFYTHILNLSSARKSTAFSRTHDCIYLLIKWLSEVRLSREPDIASAEKAFENIWQERGPRDHGYAADYRALASRLIEALVKSGAGRRFRKSEPLGINLPSGQVFVHPNEMAELPDGTVVLRRVRTGQRSEKEYDKLEYTLYMTAGQQYFGRKFQVEALHLSDDELETVSVTERKMVNRRETADNMLADIKRGEFSPSVDPVMCPRCPHFFICSSMPRGPLDLT